MLLTLTGNTLAELLRAAGAAVRPPQLLLLLLLQQLLPEAVLVAMNGRLEATEE